MASFPYSILLEEKIILAISNLVSLCPTISATICIGFSHRFAMKAAGVGLLVAVIVNLGSAQFPLRPAAVQQRQAPVEWRSTKVSA